MNPVENRFESDPGTAVAPGPDLPAGWRVDRPVEADAIQLVTLLRAYEEDGRGWPGSSVQNVLVEISPRGSAMRENIVLRDADGVIRAWGSVHDRSLGRMLLVHVVDRSLPDDLADRASGLLFHWAVEQARQVGAARGLETQQIDTGAFETDATQHRWLAEAGFRQVRTWWQMSRPVTPEEVALVPDPELWQDGGVSYRSVDRQTDGMPEEADLRAVHDVLEGAFTDHFNSSEETFEEFVTRLREDPGHRWDHWWLAELLPEDEESGTPEPCGALVGTVSPGGTGPDGEKPDGSYVSYLGVLGSARGRGVAKGLLRTVIADAAARDRDRVGLEVDADSPTGADGLYTGMGWTTKYVTQSWHKDVPVS